jgi:hypothetical protein
MREYEGMRRLVYGDALFVPVCQRCGRFVRADAQMSMKVTGSDEISQHLEPATPNATCAKCGRTAMIWEGFL